MPFVNVGKENSGAIELYYEDHGSGDPVILIHGYPLNGASWEKQTAALLKAGMRVITYDRRGFGKSSQPTTGYNYDTFAEDLHKLVTQLKLRNFSLAGFSMGGGEMARYIGKHGSKGSPRAVIIDGVPPYLLKTPDNPEGVEAPYSKASRRLSPRTGTHSLPHFSIIFTTRMYFEQARQPAGRAGQLERRVQGSATASLACVAAWQEDFRADLARIDIPTLVIHGEADRVVPIDAGGRRTASLVKALAWWW